MKTVVSNSLILIAIVLVMLGQQSAAQALPVPPAATPKFTPAPSQVYWLIYGGMTAIIVAGVLWLGRILRSDKDWTFADAMSGPDGKPSISRLIAFLGLLVMVAVILGIGYSTLWVFLQTGQLPTLSGATTFLIACAGLFTPYLANQISQAIASPPVPPPALAPVVVQTANSALQFGPPGVPNVTFGAPVRPSI